mmetsp:Transcript_44649/g.72730  ORF Transcript_44649/g.72730 Transcript_44649/m.72730 type:complete len:94 (-) Transcript_44649:290-571(-)
MTGFHASRRLQYYHTAMRNVVNWHWQPQGEEDSNNVIQQIPQINKIQLTVELHKVHCQPQPALVPTTLFLDQNLPVMETKIMCDTSWFSETSC